MSSNLHVAIIKTYLHLHSVLMEVELHIIANKDNNKLNKKREAKMSVINGTMIRKIENEERKWKEFEYTE